MMLDAREKKRLKQAAHKLKPVIRIGQKGLTENVAVEADACLDRHELIKVHISEGDRDERLSAAEELCRTVGAELVHHIGKMYVLYRKNGEPE